MVNITAAVTNEELTRIASLAKEIWEEHYTPIIGEQQVAYMVQQFQSLAAITKQIKEGNEYYSISINNQLVGYLGLRLESESLFLSKFYIEKHNRGKGLGKAAIHFVEQRALVLKQSCISLTVNKNNSNSIAMYQKSGFKIVDSIVVNIGEGYVMDDYVMEKEI